MALPSKVKPGDPIRAGDWNNLIDFVRACQVQPSANVKVTRGASGTILSLTLPPTRRVSTPDQYPFQVVVVPPQNQGDDPQLGVISDSHVQNTEDKDSYEVDNSDWGLLSDDQTSGGFDLPDIGDKIWLQFTFDQQGNLTSVDLMHGAVGSGTWDEFPDPISINTDDKPYQEYYHQIIAEVTDPEQDPRPGLTLTKGSGDDATQIQITQILETNLQLVGATTTQDADQPNLPIMVCIPWSGPATNSDGSAGPIEDSDDITTPFDLGEGEPPWESWGMDGLGGDGYGVWDVCLGDAGISGDGNFAGDFVTDNPDDLGGDVTVLAADPIEKLALLIGNTNGSETSSMKLLVGDNDNTDNDGLQFTFNDNLLELDWTTGPEIVLTDNKDDPDSGSAIDLDLTNGALLTAHDDSSNFIKLDLTDEPEIEIYSSDEGTTVLDGNSLNLTDGSSGDTIVMDVSDGSLTLTVGGNDTVLSDGDLDLGDDGTIEIGADGSITVGDSVLSDGDLDLGGSGTIEIGGDTYSPQTVSVCVNGQTQTMQVLGTTPS